MSFGGVTIDHLNQVLSENLDNSEAALREELANDGHDENEIKRRVRKLHIAHHTHSSTLIGDEEAHKNLRRSLKERQLTHDDLGTIGKDSGDFEDTFSGVSMPFPDDADD